jgi:hypothetical protein
LISIKGGRRCKKLDFLHALKPLLRRRCRLK